jgi:hypothetical protein
MSFQLFAHPWWVNLLLVVPLVAAWLWHRRPLDLPGKQLLYSALFAAAFGFVEAAVVIYIRAALGLLPGYRGSLADVRLAATSLQYAPELSDLPRSLLTVEVCREAATLVMLISVAALAARHFRERWAIFLWCFAIWDAGYYAGLWAMIRWPQSLTTSDVLFLIPVPWMAQVWFPLLVCLLTGIAVLLGRSRYAAAEVRSSAASAD